MVGRLVAVYLDGISVHFKKMTFFEGHRLASRHLVVMRTRADFNEGVLPLWPQSLL